MLEITYSYWDGRGHRKSIKVPKGTSIGKFLEAVRNDLVKVRRERRTCLYLYLWPCRRAPRRSANSRLHLYDTVYLLVQDFVELKSVAADALMYIKEDLIIPQVAYTRVPVPPLRSQGVTGACAPRRALTPRSRITAHNVLRDDREQGARQERAALPLRRARRRPHAYGRARGEGRGARVGLGGIFLI